MLLIHFLHLSPVFVMLVHPISALHPFLVLLSSTVWRHISTLHTDGNLSLVFTFE